MEVPRLGVESKLQLLVCTTATGMWDPSCICDLHHSSRQCWITDPLSKARDPTCILMDTSRIHFHCAMPFNRYGGGVVCVSNIHLFTKVIRGSNFSFSHLWRGETWLWPRFTSPPHPTMILIKSRYFLVKYIIYISQYSTEAFPGFLFSIYHIKNIDYFSKWWLPLLTFQGPSTSLPSRHTQNTSWVEMYARNRAEKLHRATWLEVKTVWKFTATQIISKSFLNKVIFENSFQ